MKSTDLRIGNLIHWNNIPCPVVNLDREGNVFAADLTQQKPDSDNICKALWDSLLKDDSKVWDVRITKYWALTGRIQVLKTI